MATTEVKLEKATNLLYFIIWAFVYLFVLPGAIALLTNWMLPWIDPTLESNAVRIASLIYVVSALGFFPFLRNSLPNYAQKWLNSETGRLNYQWGFWLLSWFGVAIVIQGLTLILFSTNIMNFHLIFSILSALIGIYYLYVFKRLSLFRSSEKILVLGLIIASTIAEWVILGLGAELSGILFIKVISAFILFGVSLIHRFIEFAVKSDENCSRMFATLVFIGMFNISGISLLSYIISQIALQQNSILILGIIAIIGVLILAKFSFLFIFPILYGNRPDADRPYEIVKKNAVLYYFFIILVGVLSLLTGISLTTYLIFPIGLMGELILEHHYNSLPILVRRWVFVILYLIIWIVFSFQIIATLTTAFIIQLIVFTILCLVLSGIMFRSQLISEATSKTADLMIGIVIYFEIAHGIGFWTEQTGTIWNISINLIYALWYSIAALVTGYRIYFGPIRKSGNEIPPIIRWYLMGLWIVFWGLLGAIIIEILRTYLNTSHFTLLVYTIGILLMFLGMDLTVILQKSTCIFTENVYWKIRQITLVTALIICTIWKIANYISYTLYLLALFFATILVYSWFLTLPKLTPEQETKNRKWAQIFVYITLVEIIVLVMALLIEYFDLDIISSLTVGMILVLIYERNVPVVRDALPLEKRVKIRTFIEWAIAGLSVYTILYLVALIWSIGLYQFEWFWMLVAIWILAFLHHGLQALGSYDHIPLVIADRICCFMDYGMAIIGISFLFFAVPVYYALMLTIIGTLFVSFYLISKYHQAFNLFEKNLDNLVLGVVISLFISFSAFFLPLSIQYFGWSILVSIFVTGLLDWGMTNIPYIHNMLGKRNAYGIHALASVLLPIIGWFAIITSPSLHISFDYPLLLWTCLIVTTAIIAMLSIISERLIPLTRLLSIYQIIGAIEVTFIALICLTYFFIARLYFTGLLLTCLILMGVLSFNHRITLWPITKVVTTRIWGALLFLESLFGALLLVDLLSTFGVSPIYAYPLAIGLFLTILVLPLQMLFDVQAKMGLKFNSLRTGLIGSQMICFLIIFSTLLFEISSNSIGVLAITTFIGIYIIFAFGTQLKENIAITQTSNTSNTEILANQDPKEIPVPNQSLPITVASKSLDSKMMSKQLFGFYLASLLVWGILSLISFSVLSRDDYIAGSTIFIVYFITGAGYWLLPQFISLKKDGLKYVFIVLVNILGCSLLYRFIPTQWIYVLLFASLLSVLSINPKWHVILQYFYISTIIAIAFGNLLFQYQIDLFPITISAILSWIVINYVLIRHVMKNNNPKILSPLRWGMLVLGTVDFGYFAIVDFSTFSGFYYLAVAFIAVLFYRWEFKPIDKLRRNIALCYTLVSIFIGVFILFDHDLLPPFYSIYRNDISVGLAIMATAGVNLILQQFEIFPTNKQKILMIIGSWLGLMIGTTMLFASMLMVFLASFIESGILVIIILNFILLFGNLPVRAYRSIIGIENLSRWSIYRPISGASLYVSIAGILSYYIPIIPGYMSFISNFHPFWPILIQIWGGSLIAYGLCLVFESTFGFFTPRIKTQFLLITWLPQTLSFGLLVSRFLESPILGILFFIGMTYLTLHYAVALKPELNTVLVRKALSLLFLIGIFIQLELWLVPNWNIGSPSLPHLLSASITLGIILILIRFKQLPESVAPLSSLLFGLVSASFEYLLFFAINPDMWLTYLGIAAIIVVNFALTAIKRFSLGFIYWGGLSFGAACMITNLVQLNFATRFLVGDWFLFGSIFNGSLYWLLRIAIENDNYYKYLRFLISSQSPDVSEIPPSETPKNDSSQIKKGLGYIFPTQMHSMELTAILGLAFALSFGLFIITTVLWAVTLIIDIPTFDYAYILLLSLICLFGFFNIPNMKYIRVKELFLEYPFLKNSIESYSNSLGQAIYISVGLLCQRFIYYGLQQLEFMDLLSQISLSSFIAFIIFYIVVQGLDKYQVKMLSVSRRVFEAIIGWLGITISLGIYLGWAAQSIPIGFLIVVPGGYQILHLRTELAHTLQIQSIRNIIALVILILMAAIVQLDIVPLLTIIQPYNQFILPFSLNLLILIWVYIGLEKLHACSFKRVEMAFLGGAGVTTVLIMFSFIGEWSVAPLYAIALSSLICAGYLVPIVKPRQLWLFVWIFLAGALVFSIIQSLTSQPLSVISLIIIGGFLYCTTLMVVGRLSVYEDIQFNPDPAHQHTDRLFLWKDWTSSKKAFVIIWLLWSGMLGIFIAHLQYLWLSVTVIGLISAILLMPIPIFLSLLACFKYIKQEQLWVDSPKITQVFDRLQIITGFYLYGSLPFILTLNIMPSILSIPIPMLAQVSLLICIPASFLLLELRFVDFLYFKFLQGVHMIRNRLMVGMIEIIAIFVTLFLCSWNSTMILAPVCFFGISLRSFHVLFLPPISTEAFVHLELNDKAPIYHKLYFINQLALLGSGVILVGYLINQALILLTVELNAIWWGVIYLSLIYITLTIDYGMKWVRFPENWSNWLRAGTWALLMLSIIIAITFSIIPPPGWLILLAFLVPTVMAFYLERLVSFLPPHPALNKVQKTFTPLHLGLSLYLEVYLFCLLFITPFYFENIPIMLDSVGLSVIIYLAILTGLGLAIISIDRFFRLIVPSIRKKLEVGFLIPTSFLTAGSIGGLVSNSLVTIGFGTLSSSLIGIFIGTILIAMIFIPYFKNRLLNQLLYFIISVELVLLLFFVGESEFAITSLILLILIYPFLFFLEKVRNFIMDLITRIQAFFAALKEQLLLLLNQLKEFFRKNWRIFWIILEIGVMIISIVVGMILSFDGFIIFFSTALILVVIAYPLSPERKTPEDAHILAEKIVYRAVLYICFIGLLFTTAFEASFISIDGAAIIFMALLVWFARRAESLYHISVKWRFIFSVITIFLIAILVAGILFELGII